MPRVIKTTVYDFDELSEKAREKAREWFREMDTEYDWGDEAMDSLKALAVHFGGKLKDWCIDWWGTSYSHALFDMPELEADEIKKRLEALGGYNPETLRGTGECKLTGYGGDEDAIDGFRIAWHKGERDLEKLMQAGFKSWLDASQKDAQYQTSDEGVDESIRANEYTFTENGKRFG